MKTEDLVELLSARLTRIQPGQAQGRFVVTLGGAMLMVLLLTLSLLGTRPDVISAASLPMFWLKLAFPGAIAVCAGLALDRLGHPGMRLGLLPEGITAAFVLVWAGSAAVLSSAAPAERASLLFGDSGPACAVLIAALSLPVSAAALWAQRALAPTRQALTGAFAGLFAGACAACAYALHCMEMQLPFVGAWYALGMLLPAAIGAIAGSKVLRW